MITIYQQINHIKLNMRIRPLASEKAIIRLSLSVFLKCILLGMFSCSFPNFLAKTRLNELIHNVLHTIDLLANFGKVFSREFPLPRFPFPLLKPNETRVCALLCAFVHFSSENFPVTRQLTTDKHA